MRPSQKQITPEQLAFAQVHALVRIVDDEADLREALSFALDMDCLLYTSPSPRDA